MLAENFACKLKVWQMTEFELRKGVFYVNFFLRIDDLKRKAKSWPEKSGKKFSRSHRLKRASNSGFYRQEMSALVQSYTMVKLLYSTVRSAEALPAFQASQALSDFGTFFVHTTVDSMQSLAYKIRCRPK